MRKKLEVEFHQFESVIVGRIIHQDESLRNLDDSKMKTLIKNDWYEILSESSPDIGAYSLFIRGEDVESDNNYFCHQFYTKEYASEWLQNIKSLIVRLNKEQCNENSGENN